MHYDFDNPNGIDYGNIEDWGDYNKQRNDWLEKKMAASNALPEGLQVGKIFTVPAADGYAYYEVVKINKRTVKIKWRENLSCDGYSCAVLRGGGSFPLRTIEDIITSRERLNKLFSQKNK